MRNAAFFKKKAVLNRPFIISPNLTANFSFSSYPSHTYHNPKNLRLRRIFLTKKTDALIVGKKSTTKVVVLATKALL